MINFLSVVWNVDPVICHIGPLALRYYSLLFVAGFPLGYWLFTKFYQKEGVDVKLIEPLLYAMLIGTIVGARLGHCLFYEPQYYLGSAKGFGEIFQPWKGGLASHGGAIGVLLGAWWYIARYGKKWDIDMLWLLDRLVIAVAFVGCLIRCGNLFNSEIYGCETSLPWGFIFTRNGETVAKHPTQIYEALCYLAIGIFLVTAYFRNMKVHRGWFFGFFLVACFGCRSIIEFIKEDQVDFEASMVGNMGQWLSVPFILAGLYFIVSSYLRKKPFLRTVSAPTHYCPPPKSASSNRR